MFKSSKVIILVTIILTLPIFIGCSYEKVRKAFNGKMATIEGNKVIREYCKSCHSHKKFEANEHVITNSKYYTSTRHKRAKECRTCHTIAINFWEEITHKTIYPSKVKQDIDKEL